MDAKIIKTQLKLSLLCSLLTGIFSSSVSLAQNVGASNSSFSSSKNKNNEFTFDKTGAIGARQVEIGEETVSANVPISEIKICSLVEAYPAIPPSKINVEMRQNGIATISISDVVASNRSDPSAICPSIDLRNFSPRIQKVILNKRTMRINIKSVTIDAGDGDLYNDIIAAGTPILTHYQSALKRLGEFSLIIGEQPEQKHFERLINTIRKVINDITDEKGNMKLPFTHEEVRESSRLILVLSDTVEEVYQRFTRSPVHKDHIEYLRGFSTNLRKIFGWEERNAGKSSRAIFALSSGIYTYLRDIYGPYSVVTNKDMTLINNTIQKVQYLMAANLSLGDAATSDQVKELAETWNNVTFQFNLQSILKSDNNEVINIAAPKLVSLFIEISSLQELTGTQFKTFEIPSLRKR